MYFSKNSRYVLQKAQWFTPTSSFFTCLRGNEKNLSIKFPKDDPTKPPLRRNVPADSPVDHYSNVIPDIRGRDVSEHRPKNLVLKTPDSSPTFFDDGPLPKCESEIRLPSYAPQQYFASENPQDEPDAGTAENAYDLTLLPTDEAIGDIFLSGEKSENPEKNDGKADGNPDGFKMRGEDKSENLGNSNYKIVHIIIDFPPKLDENLNLSVAKPENAAPKPRGKILAEEIKEPELKKSIMKQSKKWRSKSLDANGNPSKKRFEVHEIEDSGAYILHLRLKNTSGVKVVPEKEVTTRSTIRGFSVDEPGPVPKILGKATRQTMMLEDEPEAIKHHESPKSEKKGSPASDFADWQQPQYYELPVSDSFEEKKYPTSLRRLGRLRLGNSRPTSKIAKAKEEPEVSAREDLTKRKAEVPAVESEPAEKATAQPAVEEQAGEKEVIEREPLVDNEDLALRNNKEAQEHSETVKLSTEDSRPPPTDWIVPNFMGCAVEGSKEVEMATEKKPESKKKFKTSTSNNKKEKVKNKKINSGTYNPESKIAKCERSDFDITDFKNGGSSVPIKCDKPTCAVKLSAAYPPLLNEAMKRRYYRYRSNSLYNRKPWTSSGPEFEMNPKTTETTPIKITKRKERNLSTDKTTSMPKISDNICNIANESIAQNKGTASVDSLAIMKKVKEIVDLDLNNAIKIFKPDSGIVISSVVISKGVGEYRLDEKELRKCVTIQKSEFLNDIKKAESMPDFFGDVEVDPPKYLPAAKEGQTEMKLSQSVVILNPDTNKFTIDVEDLQEAIKRRTEESFDDVVVEKLRGLLAGSKSGPILVFNATDCEKASFKSGDSILVFDEQTQQWKVDYSILEKREKQLKVEEELTKRSELILETIEKLEKDNVAPISKPETRDRKTFDYNRKQWKDYGSEKKSWNKKSPFKESDAKEIRRKNSDLYNDLFVKKDKSKKTERVTSTEMKLCKEASKVESGTTKETPETKPGTISKKPEPVSGEKELPEVSKQKAEDENYWETFLNMNIPVWSEKKIIDVTEKEKSKIRPPVPPPPPAPPTPPVSSPPGPKIEEPKFRFHLPLKEIYKRKKAPEVPPKQPQKEQKPKDAVAPATKEKPKLNVPPSKPEKQKEPKVTLPPPAQSPAVKKDDPKAKPLTQPLKKEDPKEKPLPTVKKEDPKEKPLATVKKEDPKEKPLATVKKEDPKEKPLGTVKKEDPKEKPLATVKKEDPKEKPLATVKKEDPKGKPLAAEKKEDPKGKPLAAEKKEDPKGKPLAAEKKEEPKEKVTPGKKKEKEVASSTSPTKTPPKVDDKKEAKVKAPPPPSMKAKEDPKTGGRKDKAAADHYISDNIVELSRNSKDRNSKIKPNKLETVKLNISADKRLPSKVMEINLNKKFDKAKESTDSAKNKKESEKGAENRIFYKKFEKYKSPFSDLEYEEKSMKIKSDIASNPNLKKLDNWNKTLVLHNVAKPPENVETWLKDETDKMATLLLKVLQEASDGKPRRKQSRAKLTEKSQPKANPYDNIRKKQETTTPESFILKPTKSEKMLEVKRTTPKEENLVSMVPGQPATSNFDIMDPLLSKEFLRQCRLMNEITDDVPGPEMLKKISNAWKVFPVFSIQMTVFTLLRLFRLVNTGKSFLDASNPDKCRRDAFNSLFAKYGPIVNVQGPLSGSVILIYKPEHVSAVFEQDASIPVRSVFDSLEQSRRETEEKIVSAGIFTEWNTTQWAELKKKTNDPLIKGREKFFTAAEAAGDSLIRNIMKNKNQQYYESDDFMDDIKRWSLEGMCNVLFEKSFGFLEGKGKNMSWILEPDKLYRTIEEATSYLSKCERSFQMWRLMTTPAVVGLKQSYRTLSGIVAKQIYQAEANLKNRNELLKKKIEAPKELTFLESMLLNDGMTSEEITCNLIDILLVGTNAMNSALAFLLYELAQNVNIQNRLLKEVKEVLPDKGGRLDYHQLQSLKYIQACLKETLRLHMPVPVFFRMLQNDVLLSNYIVPKGTYVVMDYRVSSMREQVFEEPEKFRPERWLNDEKWIQNFHPFSTLPLCHGPRSELAKRVVEMQILACVAKIVRNFHVEYNFGEIQETNSFIAFPDKPLKFNFVERDF